MARIMIVCPETGKNIYTGMNFDWPAFESTTIGQKSLNCPKCGKTHKWSRTDAVYEEDGGEA